MRVTFETHMVSVCEKALDNLRSIGSFDDSHKDYDCITKMVFLANSQLTVISIEQLGRINQIDQEVEELLHGRNNATLH